MHNFDRITSRRAARAFVAGAFGLMTLAAPGTALGSVGDVSISTEALQSSTQYLYVMDAGNARVQKFDLSGTYITQFGQSAGINLGWGLGIDGGGNTWVAAQVPMR